MTAQEAIIKAIETTLWYIQEGDPMEDTPMNHINEARKLFQENND